MPCCPGGQITLAMILNKENLKNINGEKVTKPTPEILALPERVIQFGTGVLLRGLPDYFIDKANQKGIPSQTRETLEETEQTQESQKNPLQERASHQDNEETLHKYERREDPQRETG